MKSPLFCLALLSIVACGAAPGERGQTQQPIVGGQQSVAADDAVVMLAMDDGLCSGTLVAPNLVLTARHCVGDIDESSECGTFGDDFEPSSIGVITGVHANFDDPEAVVAHGKKLFHESSNDGCTTDIALILLDQDVPNAMVAPVRLTPVALAETARTLGYGEDGQREGNLTEGRFERDALTIDAIGPSTYAYQTETERTIEVELAVGEIVTGESTCFGDSGGPLFDHTGAVIGVTSRGVDSHCIDRPSIYSATSTHPAMIQTAFDEAGATLDAGAPDAGSPVSSSSSSSSGAAAADDPADAAAQAAPDSTEDTTHASEPGSANEGGCGVGSGLGGGGALWALAGLVLVRRRRLA